VQGPRGGAGQGAQRRLPGRGPRRLSRRASAPGRGSRRPGDALETKLPRLNATTLRGRRAIGWSTRGSAGDPRPAGPPGTGALAGVLPACSLDAPGRSGITTSAALRTRRTGGGDQRWRRGWVPGAAGAAKSEPGEHAGEADERDPHAEPPRRGAAWPRGDAPSRADRPHDDPSGFLGGKDANPAVSSARRPLDTGPPRRGSRGCRQLPETSSAYPVEEPVGTPCPRPACSRTRGYPACRERARAPT
jgi:hypothetical protein